MNVFFWQRLTLAVLPHCWDEQTFNHARGTTEVDPNRTFPDELTVGPAFDKARSAKWPTPAALLDALAQKGKTHPMYEIDVLIVARAAGIPTGGMQGCRAR